MTQTDERELRHKFAQVLLLTFLLAWYSKIGSPVHLSYGHQWLRAVKSSLIGQKTHWFQWKYVSGDDWKICRATRLSGLWTSICHPKTKKHSSVLKPLMFHDKLGEFSHLCNNEYIDTCQGYWHQKLLVLNIYPIISFVFFFFSKKWSKRKRLGKVIVLD